MEKIIGYIRYSSHAQDDGNSVAAQTTCIEQYATAHDMEIEKFYIDTAKSGRFTENRPEYNRMKEEIQNVLTGEITYAVRDTMIDDKEIHKDDFMGIGDKGLLAVTTDLNETTCKAIEEMMDDEKELISIYYGADVKEEDASALRDRIEELYDSCDVELQYGGQPVYYYIVSVE